MKECKMTRITDVFLSLIAILILLPVFLPVILILRVTGEGEIFYKQLRIGRNNQTFYVLKFATMLKDSPNLGTGTITVKDDPSRRLASFLKQKLTSYHNYLIYFWVKCQ